MIMVTFPSIKDRGEAESHPGKTTCQILCMAEYAWFEKYAGRRNRRRGEEYKALKAEWGDRLVKLMLRFYPQLEGKIDLVDVSTPLSIQHWLGADQGGAVGLDQTPSRFTDWELIRHLDARTAIPGLWLTGQDTLTCGQPVVQGSGLITAMRILGFWGSMRYLARTLPPIVRKLLADSRSQR
jgi:all-trans-retinol 13,14-reductase